MPAARAACTPLALSSITMQRPGSAPRRAAVWRKRSGRSLPWATSSALKIRSSKNPRSPVTVNDRTMRCQRPRRRQAVRRVQLLEHRPDPGHGTELGVEGGEDTPVVGVLEVGGERRPGAGLDDGADRGDRPAQVGGDALLERGGMAELGEQVGQDAVGQDLAVDHHPVVVEDDEVGAGTRTAHAPACTPSVTAWRGCHRGAGCRWRCGRSSPSSSRSKTSASGVSRGEPPTSTNSVSSTSTVR